MNTAAVAGCLPKGKIATKLVAKQMPPIWEGVLARLAKIAVENILFFPSFSILFYGIVALGDATAVFIPQNKPGGQTPKSKAGQNPCLAWKWPGRHL